MNTRRTFLQSALLLPSLFAVDAFAQDNAPSPITFADFESGDYSDWTITGDAFGTRPATDALFPSKVHGFGGKSYASTFNPRRGVLATGKAVSREFVIEKPVITFKIGGGNHPGVACLNLVVDGKIERTETGDGTAQLVSRSWDVSALVGKTAHLEIVDDTTSDRRGYVMVDDIAFSEHVSRPTQQVIQYDAPKLYQVQHSSVFTVRSVRTINSLTVWHPLPLAQPWNRFEDGLGFRKVTVEPTDGLVQMVKRNPGVYTYEVAPMDDGHAVCWKRSQITTGAHCFTSNFQVHTSRRSLRKDYVRLTWNDLSPVPEEYKGGLEKILQSMPEGMASVAQSLRRSNLVTDWINNASAWIESNINYRLNGAGPYELHKIWDNKAGSCRRRSTVFRSLCAVMGIPAREVRGYIVPSDEGGSRNDARNIACHGWAEVFLPNVGWVEVETATRGNCFDIPFTYVRNGYWENGWFESKGVVLEPTATDVADFSMNWQRLR